jgi:hypothetical protein
MFLFGVPAMRKRRQLPANTPALAYDVPGFAAAHNIGETKVWTEIREGRLKTRKVGTRTIITVEDAAAWRAQLPARELSAGCGRE